MFKRKSINVLKHGLALLTALVILAMPGACGGQPGSTINVPSGTAFPVTMVDDLGRTVTLTQEPQRIISLAPSNTEIIYALGLADKLVGVTNQCDYPFEAASKEKVGDFNMPDLEKIVSLNPDLVLAEDTHKAEVIPALERLGITCYVPRPYTLEEIISSILAVGRLTGADAKALEIASDMRIRLQYVTDKTGVLHDEGRPSVMYVVWYPPVMSVGVNTPIHDMISFAGGVSIVRDATGWPTLSLEEVVAASPEIIIANVDEYGGDIPLQGILDEPRLGTVRAVAEGRVYGIDASLTNRPVPRIIEGLEWMAALIHPELFPEFVEEYGGRLN
ncbi:MAG: cobalamin-binding protein [Dehalococcoidia bacterium]|nr:cobalamin-binding protein [Dehalococcoidia bacterium]